MEQSKHNNILHLKQARATCLHNPHLIASPINPTSPTNTPPNNQRPTPTLATGAHRSNYTNQQHTMARLRNTSLEPDRRTRKVSQPPETVSRLVSAPARTRIKSASPGPSVIARRTAFRQDQPTPVRPQQIATRMASPPQQQLAKKVVKRTGRTGSRRAESIESEGRRSSAGSENGGVMIAESTRQGELNSTSWWVVVVWCDERVLHHASNSIVFHCPIFNHFEIYPSTRLCICIHLSIIHLSICLSSTLSICLSVYHLPHPSVYLSITPLLATCHLYTTLSFTYAPPILDVISQASPPQNESCIEMANPYSPFFSTSSRPRKRRGFLLHQSQIPASPIDHAARVLASALLLNQI